MSHQEQRQNEGHYIVSVLPKSGPLLSTCARKYRDLRIHGMEESHGAVAGSYEVEKSLPISHYEHLLSQPGRYVFAIVHDPQRMYNNTNDALERGEWISLYHLRGPIPLTDWTWPNVGGLRSDDEETRWHIFSFYVKPEHRKGCTLTKTMHSVRTKFCTDYTRRLLGAKAKRDGRKVLYMRQRCSLANHNRSVEKLYRKFDWHVAGFVTMEEGQKSCENGYEPQWKEEDHAECAVMEHLSEIDVEGGEEVRAVQARL